MSSSLASVQASLDATWLANDDDGDGEVSAREMVSHFDVDGDGKLDANELEDISKAYSHQIDYSNQLLSQIQRMEQDQLSVQKEMADKTANFRFVLEHGVVYAGAVVI